VIEVTTFRLRSGVDEAEFVAADAAAQAGFFYQQRGLVRRTTARPTAGADRWAVITSWRDAATADAAAASLADPGANVATQRYLDCLEDVQTQRFEPLPG
jgi:hypothetical protein